MNFDVFSILKYTIIVQTASFLIQGGIIYTTPKQIIQPIEILENYLLDDGTEIVILYTDSLSDQYYYYLLTFKWKYELIDIYKDNINNVCYLKIRRKDK